MSINILFSLGLSLFASAGDVDCLAGFYDLGPDAAALGFFCNTDAPDTAELVYCNRDKLLRTGTCTGRLEPLACSWQEIENSWRCEKDSAYPLLAIIQRISSDRISYRFKSSFNSGALEGTKIPDLAH